MNFLLDFDKNINSLKSAHAQEASGFLASHSESNPSQFTNSLFLNFSFSSLQGWLDNWFGW